MVHCNKLSTTVVLDGYRFDLAINGEKFLGMVSHPGGEIISSLGSASYEDGCATLTHVFPDGHVFIVDVVLVYDGSAIFGASVTDSVYGVSHRTHTRAYSTLIDKG